MKEFAGKVAVITGAASGIGRGLAERCVLEGMKVVLADVEDAALQSTEVELRNKGADVFAVKTNVANSSDVERLAQRTLDHYGAVHLLFNNAGVSGELSTVWESTIADWEWVLGVNLWGVLHGIRHFVPIMQKQATEGHTECHIVNTASIAGLISANGAYAVTKHAVVALSEALALQLSQRTQEIRVSVLCPGWVNTRLMDAARNRPLEYQNDVPRGSREQAAAQAIRQNLENGMSPQEHAQHVFAAIRENRFYILPHPGSSVVIQDRMERILRDG